MNTLRYHPRAQHWIGYGITHMIRYHRCFTTHIPGNYWCVP